MPMLKICTPPPDMYSMNACMGSDLSGEMAKSQAFLVFKSSYDLNASAFVVVVAEVFPPVNLPYICTPLSVREQRVVSSHSTFDTSAKPGGGGSLLDLRPTEKMKNEKV